MRSNYKAPDHLQVIRSQGCHFKYFPISFHRKADSSSSSPQISLSGLTKKSTNRAFRWILLMYGLHFKSFPEPTNACLQSHANLTVIQHKAYCRFMAYNYMNMRQLQWHMLLHATTAETVTDCKILSLEKRLKVMDSQEKRELCKKTAFCRPLDSFCSIPGLLRLEFADCLRVQRYVYNLKRMLVQQKKK